MTSAANIAHGKGHMKESASAYGFSTVRYKPKYVCLTCVTDPTLQEEIAAAALSDSCSFCGSRSAEDEEPIGAPLEVLVDTIEDALGTEWNDPAGELPYESREGGFQGQWFDGSEIITEIEYDWTKNDNLREAVAEALVGTAWCRRHYFSARKDEVLRWGWEAFVKQVKYRTRYLFLQELGDPDEFWHGETIPAGKMLDELGDFVNDLELFKEIGSGTPFFRARVHHVDESFGSVADLGPAPRPKARASRMSPAGIPMFYGAADWQTALAETFDPALGRSKAVSIATFVAARPMLVLDLTRLPPIPSIFDRDNGHLRPEIRFLHEFESDFTKPVARDGREHIEYVPTQIMTEYLRHQFRTSVGEQLDGVLYRSSRRADGIACVLFVEADECGEHAESSAPSDRVALSLVVGAIRRIDSENLP